MNQFYLKDPAELSIHPLAKLMPEWPKDDPRFAALVEDVRERGIDHPLLIDREGRVVNGKMIFRAAKQLQLDHVPCKLVADDQIPATLINSLVQRKHFTKSALAYLTYPLMKPAFEAARQKKLEMLKKGNVSPSSAQPTTGTVEEFATNVGIERSLFFDAKRVHELFAKDAEFKAQMEPRILQEPVGGEHEKHRPMGLGAVIAGWAGRNSTLDQDRADRGQMDLFGRGLQSWALRCNYLADFTSAQKTEAREKMVEAVSQLLPEVREELKAAFKAAEKIPVARELEEAVA